MIPFLPFIGLSLVVHLCIILVNMALKRENRINIVNKKPSRAQGFLMGYIIISVVFGFVGMGAFLIVKESIVDQYSSVNYVIKYLPSVKSVSHRLSNYIIIQPMTTVSAMASYFIDSANNNQNSNIKLLGNASSVEINSKSNDDNFKTCDEIYYERAAIYNYSVTEYLIAKGAPHSPEYRSQIAFQLGINDYNGSQAQNWILLKYFFNQFKEFSDTSCSFN